MKLLLLVAAAALVILAGACGDEGGSDDPSIRSEVEPNDTFGQAAVHNYWEKPKRVRRIVGRLVHPRDKIDLFRFVAPGGQMIAQITALKDLEPLIFIRAVDDAGYPVEVTDSNLPPVFSAPPSARVAADLDAGAVYDLGVVANETSGSYRIKMQWE